MRAMIGILDKAAGVASERDFVIACVSLRGRGLGGFCGWSTCLPTGIELNLVQLPGRGSRHCAMLGRGLREDMPK